MVFNFPGIKITTLHSGLLQAGRYDFPWGGTSRNGQIVPSGVYFYRLDGEDGVNLSGKMMLVK
jgi:hypothetical protein